MSEMVERVAKALCDDTLRRWRTPIGVKDEPWREFIPAARAAIEAMREPADEMIGAAEVEQADPTPGRYRDTTDRAQHIYRAMIDAALAPSTVVPGERK